MDSNFRERVFDEDLFAFCIEIFDMLDSVQNPALLRDAVSAGFSSTTSLKDLHGFIKTLNLTKVASFKEQIADFYHNANVAKSRDSQLFEDYIMTVRHLIDVESFNAWDDLFLTFRGLTGGSDNLLKNYLMTVRHLMESEKPFLNWREFFKCALSLANTDELILSEFLMTVRHLTLPHFSFTSWAEFYKAVVMLSGKTVALIPFFTATRHVLNYFKRPETLQTFFHSLSSDPQLPFFEAYSYGQLESKKWLVDEVQTIRGNQWGTVFILAGWMGSLAQLIFDSSEIQVEKIRSFDIDAPSCKMAEKVNATQVLQDWKFKAVGMDVSLMTYPCTYFVKRHNGTLCELYDDPTLVINTSCEHIVDLKGWWDRIPLGTNLVLQNNNAFGIKDHINCVNSLDEFKAQLPLRKIEFSGALELPDYTRYMLIGVK